MGGASRGFWRPEPRGSSVGTVGEGEKMLARVVHAKGEEGCFGNVEKRLTLSAAT